MKFKAIAKASLALGMLATGVITSNTQSVQAKTEVKQQSEADLKLYYSGPSLNIKVTGYGFIEGKDRFIDFIYNGQYNKISLVGSDKDKYNEEVNPDIDVFVVREGNGRQADNHSIGGVTKLIEECITTIYTHQFLKSRKVKKNHKIVCIKFIKKTFR